MVINNLQIATNKLNCLKNNLKYRWTQQNLFYFLKFVVWIAGFYTGSAKSYGSCPLDKILSIGYLANHCLCFWTTNFIHWLAVHWISPGLLWTTHHIMNCYIGFFNVQISQHGTSVLRLIRRMNLRDLTLREFMRPDFTRPDFTQIYVTWL